MDIRTFFVTQGREKSTDSVERATAQESIDSLEGAAAQESTDSFCVYASPPQPSTAVHAYVYTYILCVIVMLGSSQGSNY